MKAWVKIVAVAVAVVCAILAAVLADRKIKRLESERDRYKGNSEALMEDCEYYRVRDSLSGIRAQGLELTVKEYERFRAEDAALIKQLKAKNRDLAAVNKTQSQTILDLQAVPRDTVVIVRDSIMVPAVSVHCGDAWYDFDGLLTKESFTGKLVNRDSLLIAETVKYKRFLGFLWKTKRIKDRRIDCVSRNPHTTLLGVEHIVVEK